MSRIPGEVHCAPRDGGPAFEKGRADIMVGCCAAYEDGPHVLLSIEQPGVRVLETALTPDAAEAIALKLIAAAAHLKGGR